MGAIACPAVSDPGGPPASAAGTCGIEVSASLPLPIVQVGQAMSRLQCRRRLLDNGHATPRRTLRTASQMSPTCLLWTNAEDGHPAGRDRGSVEPCSIGGVTGDNTGSVPRE